MVVLELVCALKLYFDNKIPPKTHTHIQTALPPGKWNSWDFNGQLTRWLDLWRWALSPSRQHMLLSAKLSYVEGSASPSAGERERDNRNIWLELASLVFLSSPRSMKHIKTTGKSTVHCLFVPHVVPVSLRPDWITTNPLSPVCGSSTWLLKKAKILKSATDPPNTHTHTHTHTHTDTHTGPSPHMHSLPLPSL